jgi:hypothetical protein
LLLAMLMGLQLRAARAEAEQSRQQAESNCERMARARVERELEEARNRLARTR